MTLDYPWYFVLLCLLAGAAYAAAMYFWGRNPFRCGLRWGLAALRFAAVSAIAFLLLAPTVRRTVHERQRPLVVLAEDRSSSVSAMHRAGDEIPADQLQNQLEGDFRLLYTSNNDNPEHTDLGALLDVPRDAAAVVLFSDGLHNRGQSPVSVAEDLGMPVYTVAVGDTTQRNDAWLSHLRTNRIAYRNSEMTVEVTVNAVGLAGQKADLWVNGSSGRTVAIQSITYTDNHFSTTRTLTIPIGDKTGLQRYDVYLDELREESPMGNNHLAFYVDVIDNRQQVVIIGAAPHPDLSALKQAVESNPNYEATMLLASEIHNSETKNQKPEFTLAILHNLPTATLTIPEAVKELPQMYVIGMQTDLPRFNAMKTGLEIVSRVKKGSELTAVYNDGFTLFQFDRGDGEALEQLPPLTAPFGEAKAGEGVQSLLTGRLGNIDSRQPLVAATSQGGRRRVFVWGEGLWRWRLGDYLNSQSHGHFDRMVGQLVNFAAQQEGRERFRVEAERIYSTMDKVQLKGQLYNESYEPINTPEATLTLTGDSIKSADFTFARQGDGYALNLGTLPAGTYRYTANTILDGQKLSAEGTFAIEETNFELATLTADHTLLRTISAATGGSMFFPDDMDALEAELRKIKPVIHTHTRHSELLTLPLVLALILLLLAAEWVMRKYHGEI